MEQESKRDPERTFRGGKKWNNRKGAYRPSDTFEYTEPCIQKLWSKEVEKDEKEVEEGEEEEGGKGAGRWRTEETWERKMTNKR